MRNLLIRKVFLVYRRLFSALYGNRCRFYPSCSHYSEAAIIERGLGAGLVLTAARLLKCHPFHRGGYDPLPPASSGNLQ